MITVAMNPGKVIQSLYNNDARALYRGKPTSELVVCQYLTTSKVQSLMCIELLRHSTKHCAKRIKAKPS